MDSAKGNAFSGCDWNMSEVANVLIIFLKYPEPHRVKTRLAAGIGYDNAALVARKLAERTLQTVCRGDYLSFVFFDPPDRELEVRHWLAPFDPSCAFRPQCGKDLGERMRDAFAQVFRLPGVQRAVIIGTDCLELDHRLVQQAFRAMDQYPVVIGPATDGGYYLLGLSRPLPSIFENMPWSTGLVLARTLETLKREALSCHLLPELRDIDTIDELNCLWPDWKAETG